MKFISVNGYILNDEESIIIDSINCHMKLDIKDTPLCNIGIVYNFNKSNLSSCYEYLGIVMGDVISSINNKNLSLDSINYQNNEFIITIKYNNKDLLLKLSL